MNRQTRRDEVYGRESKKKRKEEDRRVGGWNFLARDYDRH
jgi:hypothetical protein